MSVSISEGYEAGCIGRVAQLHATYYAATSGFGAEFEAKVAREMGDFCLSYTRNRDGLWLAKETDVEGSIAIDASQVQAHGAHLRWFITSEKLRGQGIGKALLVQALAFADQRRYGNVFLWTFEGLDAARHLYESHGFKLELQRQGAQWGKVVNEQRYVRSVA